MARTRVQRKLAAIMAADVAGYSRLMEADEIGTRRHFKAHYEELIAPAIAENDGRIVKTTGDGLLAEFASAVNAVYCASFIQDGMEARQHGKPAEDRMDFRIGINLGDIVIEDDDIFGDGVNIAARLEQLAEPGGVLISASVLEQVNGKLGLQFEDAGLRSAKNIAKPLHTYRVCPHRRPNEPAKSQEIAYCRSSDGVRLAVATVGEGPPVIKAPNWLNHLEYDWESPVWRHMLRALSERNELVRFDARGTGLSDWDVDDISFDAFVRDLEAVIDSQDHERFALLGISQGCAISIAYAARHPERVSRLVLIGGFAVGWRKLPHNQGDSEQREAMVHLARSGWGQENPAFRQLFTSLFIPGATVEQMQWFNDLQCRTTSPENAARILEALANLRVHRLLRRVKVPTLVMHARGDAMIPFEAGRFLAKEIPNARFLPFDGNSHLIMEHEPSWPKVRNAILEFLESEPAD